MSVLGIRLNGNLDLWHSCLSLISLLCCLRVLDEIRFVAAGTL